jgi:beta-carotene hydroxylase
MQLRYAADYRTLLWAFVFFPGVAIAQYADPSLVGWLTPIGLYLGFCAGVFSHNQNHCPTFAGKRANVVYAAYLSFFYGYPTFAWIPTHNLNHHKFVNKPGDATITWRYTEKHTWAVASTYFFVSAYWQSGPIKQYIRKARAAENPAIFRQIVAQYAIVFGLHAALVALALWLHGPLTGALVYLSAFGLPAFFALWSMIFINYIQHVHCDPWSKHNHSRNFVGKVGNFFVFNNGLHTVHHENAAAHWSTLPALHARIEAEIDPALKQGSIFGFCLRTYVLGPFAERFRTKQVGRAASDPPASRAAAAAPVDEIVAVGAGVNEAMV